MNWCETEAPTTSRKETETPTTTEFVQSSWSNKHLTTLLEKSIQQIAPRTIKGALGIPKERKRLLTPPTSPVSKKIIRITIAIYACHIRTLPSCYNWCFLVLNVSSMQASPVSPNLFAPPNLVTAGSGCVCRGRCF